MQFYYWFFKNIPLNERPIIHFNDKTKTISISSNKIVIKSQSKYEEAKKNLEPYSKLKSKTLKSKTLKSKTLKSKTRKK